MILIPFVENAFKHAEKTKVGNAFDALAFLKSHPVDLMFLDINLGEFSGIQLLETATIYSQVVLATAYPDYALKGYELKVADYLLNPYTFDRFMQAVNRVQELIDKKGPPQSRPRVLGGISFLSIKNRKNIFLSKPNTV